MAFSVKAVATGRVQGGYFVLLPFVGNKSFVLWNKKNLANFDKRKLYINQSRRAVRGKNNTHKKSICNLLFFYVNIVFYLMFMDFSQKNDKVLTFLKTHVILIWLSTRER